MAESYRDFQMEYEQLAEQGSQALLRGDFAGYANAARLLACKVNRIQAGDVNLPAVATCIRWPRTSGAWSICAGANYRLLEADAAKKGGARAADFLFSTQMLDTGEIGEPYSQGSLGEEAAGIVERFKGKSRQARLESLLNMDAKKCYDAASAGKDDPDMQALLGVCYLKGWGVEASETKAWQLFAAVEKESPFAQFCLGVCCETSGVGEADKWYRLAASNGCWKAAALLETRSPQAKKVAKHWFELCRKYAQIGQADAMFNLAQCYKEGKGVAQNDAKADEWYRKAAELGSSDASKAL